MKFDDMPVERVSRKALDSLPEYSLSLPTGTFVGKVWKRNLGLTDPPTWVICEYVDVGVADAVGNDYRRPDIQEERPC